MDDITIFATTNARNDRRRFGIKQSDRLAHVYIVGKTGTGKSTLLETMVRQDIAAGRGMALLDPHGDLVERIADAVPDWRRAALAYLNVANPQQPYGYNPLRRVADRYIPLATSGLIEILKKRWADAWGVRMEHILRNTIMALLEQPKATLRDIPRLFADRTYRRQVAGGLRNDAVRLFFEREYDRFSFAYRSDGIAPIQNKIGAFLADPVLNRILTEPKVDLHIRRLMDTNQILLVNLAKGRIGEDSASLLGGLLVTTIGLAALSRADAPGERRTPFFVYVDEFQSFTTLALANMLAELRKYAVGFTVAHQYMQQVDRSVRDAVLGNVGTLIAFRVGADDGYQLSREFEGRFGPADFLRLPNYHIYIRLMIDGAPARPFSAETLMPPRA